MKKFQKSDTHAAQQHGAKRRECRVDRLAMRFHCRCCAELQNSKRAGRGDAARSRKIGFMLRSRSGLRSWVEFGCVYE